MLTAGELIEYEIYGLTVGDTFDAREVHTRIFDGEGVVLENFMTLGCRNTRLNELDTNDTKLKDLHADDMMKYQLAEIIRGAVSGMLRAESIYDLLEHAGIGFTFDGVGTQYEELFFPINDRSRCEDHPFSCFTAAIVGTFLIPENADCVVGAHERELV